MKHVKKILISIFILVFVLSACNNKTANAEKSLRLVVNEDAPSLNNFHETGFTPANIFGNSLEGLMQYDKDGNLKGALAEKWEISEDNLTYTFTLRDANWANGDKVTANDFVFAWKTRLVDKEAPYNHYFEHIKNAKEVIAGTKSADELGVKAVDDKTLVLELNKPSAYFLGMLQFFIFYPVNEKFFTEVTAEKYGTSPENYLASGAYTITKFQADKGWTLEKNTAYWDAQNVNVDKIEVSVVKEASTQAVLWDNGEIDAVELTSDLVDKYQNDPLLQTTVSPKINFFYLSNETNVKVQLLGNQNFRAAIAHSIDKSVITDTILKDGSVPAEYYIPSHTTYVDGEDFRDFSPYFKDPIYNVAKAQEYLAQAQAELGDVPLTFTLTIQDVGMTKKVYENIQSQIEANLPGVKVTLESVPATMYSATLKEKNTPAASKIWQSGYADVEGFMPAYTTDQSQNSGNWHNAEFTELFNQAESAEYANKPKERWEIYAEIEKKLLEDYSIIPIYQSGKTYLVRDNVKGYQINPMIPHVDYRFITVE